MKNIIIETEETTRALNENEFISLAKKEWKEDTEANPEWRTEFSRKYPRSVKEINSIKNALWFIEKWFKGRYVAITINKNGRTTRRELSAFSERYTVTKDFRHSVYFNNEKYGSKIKNTIKKWDKLYL